MEMITVPEAAKLKACSGQAVRNAIKAGRLDAQEFGRVYAVKCNKKWEEWAPNPKMQAAGAVRRKAKKTKKQKQN